MRGKRQSARGGGSSAAPDDRRPPSRSPGADFHQAVPRRCRAAVCPQSADRTDIRQRTDGMPPPPDLPRMPAETFPPTHGVSGIEGENRAHVVTKGVQVQEGVQAGGRQEQRSAERRRYRRRETLLYRWRLPSIHAECQRLTAACLPFLPYSPGHRTNAVRAEGMPCMLPRQNMSLLLRLAGERVRTATALAPNAANLQAR